MVKAAKATIFKEKPTMLRRKLLTGCCVLALGALATASLPAQNANGKPPLSPPEKASVTLNGKSVTIDYSAPSMRGRKIFGGLVPYDHWWRTGANPATTLKTETALKIGSLSVPAGTYTVYSIPSADTWKLVINKQTGQWGTVYKEDQDLGRTDMEKGKTPTSPVETFQIKFDNTTGGKTELHLVWETTDVYVTVEAP